jgi:hypothetical protein
MLAEIQQMYADHVARGIYESGITQHAERAIRTRYTAELRQHQRDMIRRWEDSLHELGPLERLWVKWRWRNPNPSLEQRIFSQDEPSAPSANA